MHWIDPDHLPEFTGTVDQFLVNKHGEAHGFLLTDGEEVHVPQHLSARLLRDVRPGSQVKVRGVRPRGVQMIAAVAIDTPKGRILDEGPEARDDDTIDVTPYVPAASKPTGSDAGSIGAWPARHLLGTQLGPNRNGRKW
jgi:hypothetical protein